MSDQSTAARSGSCPMPTPGGPYGSRAVTAWARHRPRTVAVGPLPGSHVSDAGETESCFESFQSSVPSRTQVQVCQRSGTRTRIRSGPCGLAATAGPGHAAGGRGRKPTT
jgi:hypothetical protein